MKTLTLLLVLLSGCAYPTYICRNEAPPCVETAVFKICDPETGECSEETRMTHSCVTIPAESITYTCKPEVK